MLCSNKQYAKWQRHINACWKTLFNYNIYKTVLTIYVLKLSNIHVLRCWWMLSSLLFVVESVGSFSIYWLPSLLYKNFVQLSGECRTARRSLINCVTEMKIHFLGNRGKIKATQWIISDHWWQKMQKSKNGKRELYIIHSAAAIRKCKKNYIIKTLPYIFVFCSRLTYQLNVKLELYILNSSQKIHVATKLFLTDRLYVL